MSTSYHYQVPDITSRENDSQVAAMNGLKTPHRTIKTAHLHFSLLNLEITVQF